MSMGGKNVMLDCGMHMGFNDEVHVLRGGCGHLSPSPLSAGSQTSRTSPTVGGASQST